MKKRMNSKAALKMHEAHPIYIESIAVCLSGGIDSACVLSLAINKLSPPPKQVLAVRIKYPSKHNALEREASKAIAEYYGVPSLEIDLTEIFSASKSSSLIGDEAVPEGHYNEETMRSTVVPMRNLIIASVVASRCIEYFGQNERFMLAMGIHAGDHHIYPDCRPETARALDMALYYGSDKMIRLWAPYIYDEKRNIVAHGAVMGVPFHLTRTCYTSDTVACGKCGSCCERLEAFELNGLVDPLEYQK